ncbi:MAG: alanine racemase [Gemmatimonadota bacterium]|nr:alanine racemase [Gemmatimonadota bacterium]
MSPAHRPTHPRDRAWVEVDLAAIRRNLDRVREVAGAQVKLVTMVKADGYGLGVRRVLEAIRPAGPFGYGVATLDEGLELLRLGLPEPIMVYTPLPHGSLARCVGAGLIPAVSDLDTLAALGRLAAPPSASRDAIPFQIEVDTGMGRAGFHLGEAATWWPEVMRATRAGLRLFGIFTHLHSADHPELGSARAQVSSFDRLVRDAAGIGPDVLVHCANSAGSLRLVSRTANAVRPGIYLYGGDIGDPANPPRPVAAVRARVVLVREVPPGATLGYGATYAARATERWAAVGIGYGDGLPRVLGNRGWAIAGGSRVPILGRISMDTTVVRVSGDVSVGDIVTFVGRDGEAELSLEEVAESARTIGYEILTGLSSRLPRVRI